MKKLELKALIQEVLKENDFKQRMNKKFGFPENDVFFSNGPEEEGINDWDDDEYYNSDFETEDG